MIQADEMARDLRVHLTVCQELLQLVERENRILRSEDEPYTAADFHQLRKKLLPRLEESLARLKFHRLQWQRLTPAMRRQHAEVASCLRLNQDLAMKILVLDRENEQLLLRKGLLPANQLPPANRQRPHFVADLYRRHGI